MAEFNKTFKYKGYEFITSVQLNTRVERRIDGKKWHTIITNCTGANNFYTKDEIETLQIEGYVEKHKQFAIDYVDKLTCKEQSYEERLLSLLGFS